MSVRVDLDAEIVDALRAQLPDVAEHVIGAVTHEVAEYSGAFGGVMGGAIRTAVQMALGGFLRLAAEPEDADPATPMRAAVEGAYALGRGEARSGRTMDALLAAYRAGARVAWRELSATAVQGGLQAPSVAQFAELVFAYIDELSAASAAGHTDELATSGRVREQYLEQLGRALLDGAPPEALQARADRADWTAPEMLTAALLPSAHMRSTLAVLPTGTLVLSTDVAELEDLSVLLMPGTRSGRASLLRALRTSTAVIGDTRPWTEVRSSYLRAVRSLAFRRPGGPVDTDEHLTALVLNADPDALRDLREQALAPLAGLREGTAERLAETLRSWLLHQGRREDVAAHLVVHPQTVRYRMTQLRDLYGDRLTDPEQVLSLVVALGAPSVGGGL